MEKGRAFKPNFKNLLDNKNTDSEDDYPRKAPELFGPCGTFVVVSHIGTIVNHRESKSGEFV